MSPPRPSRLRPRWLPGAVLLGVALLVWLVLPWPEHDAASSVPPSSPRASPPTSVLAPPPASGKTSAARPPPVLTAAAPAPPREEAPPGTTPARPPPAPPIELPPTTQALSEEFYPGTTEWEDVPVDESHAHRLRILPPRYNVVAPRPLAVWLEMVDAQGQRQPLSSPHVRMRLLDGASRPWIDVPVRDDGQGEDEAAGDRRYTASLQPTQEQKKALLGHVLMEARVDVPGGGTRMIPAVLLYTEGPRARLTGRWSDSVREGHLVLEAGLQVDEPGRFTLMAQVFGPHLEPLAWVKQTQTLEAGRRSMTLEVFGKLLREQGIDGPYRVRQVLLTRDRENASEYDPGETVVEAHQTRAYPASDFAPEAYVPPVRTVVEVTADHASQRDKPAPERMRVSDTPRSALPDAGARGRAPPADLGR